MCGAILPVFLPSCPRDDRRCPAIIGQKKGATSLLVRQCEAAGHTQSIYKMHCIIHQEALRAKSANLVDVMSVVVKVVNAILSRSLNHRKFQALVDEVDMQYGDLLAKFAGWVEEHCCPVCATCRRRSPPFFVRRIFPTVTSSSTRDGSLA